MKSRKILVIDDDETLLKIVESVLTSSEFTVLKTLEGEKGLKMARAEKPDAILLDRKMPGISGNEVLEQLKNDEETKHIPVLMLTGDNNITEVSKSLDLGAQDYIVKPFDNENLIVRLKNILIKRNKNH